MKRAWIILTPVAALFALLVFQCCSSPPSTSPDGDGDPEPDDPVREELQDIPVEDIPVESGDEDARQDMIDDDEGDDAVDIEEPDDGHSELPDYCGMWEGLSNLDLLQALHAHLHDAYEPIEAMENEAGEPDRYVTARFFMFTAVEWVLVHETGRDGIECVYTGTFIPSAEGEEPHHSIMNCEHTWPRSAMDPDRSSLLFSHQESDIHALYPALPSVNSARGSFPFGEPVSDLDTFVNPDDPTLFAVVGLNSEGERVFQPREERRGDISRAMFYFSVRWGKDIGEGEEGVLRLWYVDDPVDDREQDRSEIIFLIQGNRNPFVDCPDLVDRIDDFRAFDILDTNDNLPPP